MTSRSRVLAPIFVLGVLAVFFIVLFVLRKGGVVPTPEIKNVHTIVLTNNGSQFSIDVSGNAISGNSSELWTQDKTKSFFDYFYNNWTQNAAVVGDTAYVTLDGSDELGNIVTGGGGGSGGGGDLSQFFTSPTPSPSGGGSGGGGTGGGGSGGGGNNGGPSWCLHWRLSYCADPPPDTSTPYPTPTPTTGPTPLPPDCNDPGNQETGRTVIGNELCLPSPTPTPTP